MYNMYNVHFILKWNTIVSNLNLNLYIKIFNNIVFDLLYNNISLIISITIILHSYYNVLPIIIYVKNV